MFVKTDLQRSLLECEFLLPAEKAERLRKSWAHPFRERVLPLIDEEVFRDAYSEGNGRPNKSIRLMVALHLLKEWNDLTDEQVLDELEYNLQWHYALYLESEETHTCQKTLHNFRVKLMENERARQLFEKVTRALAEADGVSFGRQRLDSTHVLSNIAVLTRLGLFVETVTHFLKELRKEAPAAFASLRPGYAQRYLDREGYFSDAKREQARRRLKVVAEDVYALVSTFEEEPAVSALRSFEKLVRLFEEQCEVVEAGDDDGCDEDGDGEQSCSTGKGMLRARVIDPKEVASNSLQSPHDPDATYGHKGKGYEAQVVETCSEENPYQVITSTMVNGAHESDQKAVLPMLDRLEQSEMMPEELIADTGYGSGENIVESAKRGVNLQAPVQNPDAPTTTDHFVAPVADDVTSAVPREPGAATAAASESSELEHALGLEAFAFAPTSHEVRECPAGKEPACQHMAGNQLIATFSAEHCGSCPLRARCPTRALLNGDRQLRRSPASIATEVRQAEQQTPAFKERYRIRSGIESTNEELKGRHGLGDLRIRGKPRVELAVTLKTLALNVKRAVQWHVTQLATPLPCPC
jgi:hypothetical protein